MGPISRLTPMLKSLKQLNYFSTHKNYLTNDIILNFLVKTTFLTRYYKQNDMIWQEGLLIDFVQKKVMDKWLRRFVIHSANLFSERFLFDKVIRFYIDLILWPGTRAMVFEFTSVASLLTVTLLPLLTLFLLLVLFFFFPVFTIIL